MVEGLTEDLRHLRDLSQKHQAAIAEERIAQTPLELQNVYQPGDLVLLETDPSVPRRTKLSPLNLEGVI